MKQKNQKFYFEEEIYNITKDVILELFIENQQDYEYDYSLNLLLEQLRLYGFRNNSLKIYVKQILFDLQKENVIIFQGNRKNLVFNLLQFNNKEVRNNLNYSLITACYLKNNLNGVRKLIECGADVNFIDLSGKTPLMYATICENGDVIEQLVKNNCNINLVNDDGWSAIFFATFYFRKGMLIKLLELGANPRIKSKKGKTILDLIQNYNKWFYCLYGNETIKNDMETIIKAYFE